MIKGLPEKLRELRLQKHLSQKEVAKILDVSPSIISGYENGERTPSLENLLALSHLYKCSTDYLLGKSQSTPPPLIDVASLSASQIKALQIFIHSFTSGK